MAGVLHSEFPHPFLLISILKCDGAINVGTNDGPPLDTFILNW